MLTDYERYPLADCQSAFDIDPQLEGAGWRLSR